MAGPRLRRRIWPESLRAASTVNESRFPGMCLNTDGALLTCIGNDYGFDEIFARQVSSLGNRGDVFVLFSTSGNSENCLRAIHVAKERGLITAAFLGKGGGRTAGLADYDFTIASNSTMRIQECHQFLMHMLCEKVERAASEALTDSIPPPGFLSPAMATSRLIIITAFS